MLQTWYIIFSTFDDVSDVMVLADECSVDGALNAKLLLHRLGVTFQVGVGLTHFVHKHIVILKETKVHI